MDGFIGYSVLDEFENLSPSDLVILATEVSMVWMFLHEESQARLEELMVQVFLTRRSSSCKIRTSASTSRP